MGKALKRVWIIALALLFGVSVFFLMRGVTVSHAESDAQVSAYNGTAYNGALSKDSAADENAHRSVDEYLGFYLNGDGTGYKVRLLDKSLTEVRIPSEYNGLPVTEIAGNGFLNSKNLKTVFIPTSVKKIGPNAFFGCSVLECVYGATKVQDIGISAFSGCEKLKDFYISDSVVKIGDNAFRKVDNDIFVEKQEENFLSMSGISQLWDNALGENGSVVYNTLAETVSSDEVDSAFGFLLTNNDTEYKIRLLDKTLTEVEIPSEYNGLPVTEIANSGFMNSKSLKTVYIPSSIRKIGANAFFGCNVLERAYGAVSVQDIGISAFSGCIQLKYFCVYDCIVTMGSNVFRNVANDIYIRMDESVFAAISGINSGWANGRGVNSNIVYGTEQICEALGTSADDDGYKLIHAQEVLSGPARTEDPPYFYCSEYNNGVLSPVYQIDSYAFEHWQGESLIIEYDKRIKDENGDPFIGFSVYFCNQAFINMPNCTTLEINVNFSINDPDDDSIYSIGVFMSSIMLTTITMTDSITVIPDNTFSGCQSLSSINYISETDNDFLSETDNINFLSEKITYIGERAFSGCYSMPEIHIPSSVTSMGDNVFEEWGSSVGENGETVQQTVYFDAYMPPQNASAAWNSGMGIGASIIYNTKTVTLNSQGGTSGTQSVDAMYGQKLSSQAVAPQPTVDYLVFDGYYSAPNGGGEKYYDAEMVGQKEWGKDEIDAGLTELYAKWVKITVEVKLILDDDDNCEKTVDVKYDEPFVAVDVATTHKAGYTFNGFYSERNGGGTQFYGADLVPTANKYTDLSVTELYAYWTPIRYQVALLPDGGAGGTELVYIPYQTELVYLSETSTEAVTQITAPTRNGYIFMGFYMGDTQYFAPVFENGQASYAECVKAWDMPQNNLLQARWEVNYTIIINYAGYTGDQTPVTSIDRNEVENMGGTYYTEELRQVKDGIKMTWAPVAITADSPNTVTVNHTDTYASLSDCYDSETDAYQIWYKTQLYGVTGVQEMIGDTVKFQLMQDIDFGANLFAEPIIEDFAGTFNGNGHSITGLNIAANRGNIGLFGQNSGTIKNLNVSANIEVGGSSVMNVGIICGVNTGTVSNCSTSGNSLINGVSINCSIGGIVGYNNNGIVINCTNSAAIRGKGNFGGIAGACSGRAIYSQILHCVNKGTITALLVDSDVSIGGIVGVFSGGNIDSCTSSGQIKLVNNPSDRNYYSPSAGTVVGTRYSLGTVVDLSTVTIDGIILSGRISTVYIGGEVGRTIQ